MSDQAAALREWGLPERRRRPLPGLQIGSQETEETVEPVLSGEKGNRSPPTQAELAPKMEKPAVSRVDRQPALKRFHGLAPVADQKIRPGQVEIVDRLEGLTLDRM